MAKRKKRTHEHCWSSDARSTEEVDLCGVEDEECDAIVTYLSANSISKYVRCETR